MSQLHLKESMQKASVTALYTPNFQELRRLFQAFKPPYGATEIRHFNRLYRRLYPELTVHEKRQAEQWVEQLAARVEPPELARQIYGMV